MANEKNLTHPVIRCKVFFMVFSNSVGLEMYLYYSPPFIRLFNDELVYVSFINPKQKSEGNYSSSLSLLYNAVFNSSSAVVSAILMFARYAARRTRCPEIGAVIKTKTIPNIKRTLIYASPNQT